ncbi:unnamed protein product [Trichobilharzia regenti]|nr:unnamed protein product [Trichobilharzia regenti]
MSCGKRHKLADEYPSYTFHLPTYLFRYFRSKTSNTVSFTTTVHQGNTVKVQQAENLVAYDPDSTSQLTYTMASSLEYHVMSTTFHIESDGHVRLRSSLDYELRQIYSIPIEVTDGEFSSRTTLNVQVVDVNDEPPAFELNPKQLVADENSLPGKLIGQVSSVFG